MDKKIVLRIAITVLVFLSVGITLLGAIVIFENNKKDTQEFSVNSEPVKDADLPEFIEPQNQSPKAVLPKSDDMNTNEAQTENAVLKEIDVEQINGSYKFTVQIPSNYEVEYIAGTEAINIYNPKSDAENNLQKSQIFIRKFSANNFQTLPTVNILREEETSVSGRPAVRYEIEKKVGVPSFENQPSWRSNRHKLIDIRYSQSNPSIFYVFSYSPDFGEGNFDEFINLIQFKESFAGFVDPLPDMAERDIIKPYGIYITPENSPVSPENFRGYHNALDLEPLSDDPDTPVFAICDGEIIRKTTATGYGGYLVQECLYQGGKIQILYGHIDIQNTTSEQTVLKGDQISVLGEPFSSETDGERKHLHLAIQQSGSLDIRGYVQSEGELSKWLDPEMLLPFAR